MSFESAMNSGVDLMETLAGDSFTIGGASFVGNFRTGNSLEQAEASEAMRLHGYPQAGVVLILHVARSRFSAPPLDWKRQKIKRLTPTPAEYTVASINTDDPNVYALVLIGRQ